MKKLLLPLIAALAFTACATPQQYSAADDIHEFLIAVRDNDRAMFNAHVDRNSLSRQVESRLLAELPRDGVTRGIGLLLAAPAADAVTSLLAQPRVFRAVAVYNGYDPDKPIPRKIVIAQVLRNAGNGRVCIGDADDPCTLVFTRLDGAWKLTAFQGDLKDLRAS
jgi:hypothetical protein